MTNINDLLREHVTLTVECLDRLYLNGYIPTLQTPGQLVNFLIRHRGHKIPSPVLLGRITQGFVRAVKAFAQENNIPLVHEKPPGYPPACWGEEWRAGAWGRQPPIQSFRWLSPAACCGVVNFERGQRKDDVATRFRKGFNQSEGVVFIGVAQEKANL